MPYTLLLLFLWLFPSSGVAAMVVDRLFPVSPVSFIALSQSYSLHVPLAHILPPCLWSPSLPFPRYAIHPTHVIKTRKTRWDPMMECVWWLQRSFIHTNNRLGQGMNDGTLSRTGTSYTEIPGGLVVRIRRSHRRGRGSIPRLGIAFGKSI